MVYREVYLASEMDNQVGTLFILPRENRPAVSRLGIIYSPNPLFPTWVLSIISFQGGYLWSMTNHHNKH